MNQKAKFILIFVVLLLIAFSGIFYFCKEYPEYSENSQALSLLLQKKLTAAEIKQEFENTTTKYHNNEIEKRTIFGYNYSYVKDGIYFLSVTPYWDEQELQALAEELYQNKHGDEINYLDKVIVYGTSDGVTAGSHSRSIYGYEVPVSFYGFIPENLTFDCLYEKSTINIYGVSDETKIEDLAIVLSHEYGHHFTYHNFGLSGSAADRNTEYYKLRFDKDYDVILDREYYEDYLENHKWYLSEIAAEDYVYLMGSENTFKVQKFYDNADKATLYNAGKIVFLTLINYDYKLCKNGMPHENVSIPLPYETEGLADYFYSFVDDEYSVVIPDQPIGTLNLTGTPNGARTQHIFTWDQPFTSHDVAYTVIGYDMDDNVVIMLKTTRGDEKAVAGIGVFGGWMNPFTIPDKDLHAFTYEPGKKMKFRVSVSFPDGLVLLSDPIIITY
ncbi:MAG: hypothetical protein JXN65_10030 [Clostridia bacterium]|nr:hypothetical protein [Clostridia bacterium]